MSENIFQDIATSYKLHENEFIRARPVENKKASSIKKVQHTEDYLENNRIKLVRGGKDFFDLMVKLINEAKEEIHLQTYIYDDDETGIRVANALKAAVQRQVKVYLLADGYASQVMSHKFIHELKQAGIHFRFFEPVFRSKYFYFGRRLHHKVFVVDSLYALVGGINVSNRYNDMPLHPAWLDFALFTEGEIAKQLCVLCWKTWKGFPPNMGITSCEQKEIEFQIPLAERSKVRMRRNDWVRRKNQISRSYVELLKNTRSNATILCSYFLPGQMLKKSLVQAIKRGVKIKVVLAGLSDVKVAKYAERYIYNWLLRNKIDIYEYQGNVLHGKVATFDNKWLTIGSYNVNNISAYASIELNLDVYDPLFVTNAEEILNTIITEKSVQITEERLARTSNIFKRFARWTSYGFIKVCFYLFTFYFRHRS